MQFIYTGLIFEIPYMNHPNITNTNHDLNIPSTIYESGFQVKPDPKAL